jgi:hypothetical protein
MEEIEISTEAIRLEAVRRYPPGTIVRGRFSSLKNDYRDFVVKKDEDFKHPSNTPKQISGYGVPYVYLNGKWAISVDKKKTEEKRKPKNTPKFDIGDKVSTTSNGWQYCNVESERSIGFIRSSKTEMIRITERKYSELYEVWFYRFDNAREGNWTSEDGVILYVAPEPPKPPKYPDYNKYVGNIYISRSRVSRVINRYSDGKFYIKYLETGSTAVLNAAIVAENIKNGSLVLVPRDESNKIFKGSDNTIYFLGEKCNFEYQVRVNSNTEIVRCNENSIYNDIDTGRWKEITDKDEIDLIKKTFSVIGKTYYKRGGDARKIVSHSILEDIFYYKIDATDRNGAQYEMNITRSFVLNAIKSGDWGENPTETWQERAKRESDAINIDYGAARKKASDIAHEYQSGLRNTKHVTMRNEWATPVIKDPAVWQHQAMFLSDKGAAMGIHPYKKKEEIEFAIVSLKRSKAKRKLKY